jgi:hypothetical protein
MQCYLHCRSHCYNNVRGINISYRRTERAVGTSETSPLSGFLGLFYHSYTCYCFTTIHNPPTPCKLNIHASSQTLTVLIDKIFFRLGCEQHGMLFCVPLRMLSPALHCLCQLHATAIGDVSPADNLTWLPTRRRELTLSITGNA